MTIRTIPNFLLLDPADLGYPMSHERRMRAAMARPDAWALPERRLVPGLVEQCAAVVEQGEA